MSELRPERFGRYLLIDKISVGGMAEVFLAKAGGEAGFEKVLAIKRILPVVAEDADFRAMFVDEAQISARLNHPNIGQVLEFREIGGTYFISMEYVPGQDVRSLRLRMDHQRRYMPVSMAMHIIGHVCQALDYAHRQSYADGRSMEIVHRDVSPPNVLCSYEGEVKLIDFGVAKAAGRVSKTQAGILKGRDFTLHWENQPAFAETFMGLVPTGQLYESDRGLLTCGGGSAATDMMLEIIERDHGADLALIVADMCLHYRSGDRMAPQRSAYSAALGGRNPRLITAIDFMSAHIEDPVEIEDIAGHVGLSRRQLERLFKRYVGSTPAQFYIELRVARAHALLNDTNLTVAEIAAATGFVASSQLSQRFRKRYGKSPRAYRRGWIARE